MISKLAGRLGRRGRAWCWRTSICALCSSGLFAFIFEFVNSDFDGSLSGMGMHSSFGPQSPTLLCIRCARLLSIGLGGFSAKLATFKRCACAKYLWTPRRVGSSIIARLAEFQGLKVDFCSLKSSLAVLVPIVGTCRAGLAHRPSGCAPDYLNNLPCTPVKKTNSPCYRSGLPYRKRLCVRRLF